MSKQLFVFVILNALCLYSVVAVPLQQFHDEDYDNEDDSDVIEITANTLEEPKPSKDIIDLSAYGQSMYGYPDESTAKLIDEYNMNETSVNPEELGSYLEGDILFPSDTVLTKNGLVSQSSRWRNGVVPFEIRGNFAARDRALIEQAMEQYHRRTCIRFVPRSNEQDYISIVNGHSGCWSSVGRVGGKQEVNLQSPGCLSKVGTPLHELMHAVGFLHEQNRQERDSFVSIQYNNIQPQAGISFIINLSGTLFLLAFYIFIL